MDRLTLHDKLLMFTPNVYFQKPSEERMVYPCILYTKNPKNNIFSNDGVYLSKQGYQLTVIDTNIDGDIADRVERYFPYCSITQYYTVDGLHHTTLTLFY